VQAGTYNTRLLVPEVLVDGDRFPRRAPRQTYDELIGLDSMPGWLCLCGAALAACPARCCRRQPVRQRLLARPVPPVPDVARIGLVGLFAWPRLASLWPLRFFRKPTWAEIDRRIESANELLHTPVLVQTDRPAAKDERFCRRAVARAPAAHGRKAGRIGRRPAAHPRAGARSVGPARRRALLLLVVAFAFSFGPLRRTHRRRLSAPMPARRRCRRASTPG
jgi:hypothetical protein